MAEHIAVKPHTGIYRRFDALNARHILYLQAELCILERRLRNVERADQGKDKGRLKYAVDFERMLETPNDEDQTQLELIMEMHEKLHQYNEAIIQVLTIRQIQQPDKFDLVDLQAFLGSADMDPDYLEGEDRTTWGSLDEPCHYASDLIAIDPRRKEDDFSRFVSENAVHLFKCGLGRLTKGDKHLGQRVYYDSTVLKVTSWITCILASMLPIASVLVLVHLESLKTKLWVIAAFNILTSVCLRTLTEAKRAEVFAVTAA
ncbi:hypothetical protein J4E91_009849 [Alternaria rosae]|nr:hypothetical protein J4E91_009849 [Alternaria rosae]